LPPFRTLSHADSDAISDKNKRQEKKRKEKKEEEEYVENPHYAFSRIVET
jgi:hypothetical protein